MSGPTKLQLLEKSRRAIAERVRELRRESGWTQSALAEELGLSQNRLSEIERGNGSFTAEQLLVLLSLFNLDVTSFAPTKTDRAAALQNALARLGATQLRESRALASKELSEAHDVIVEALLEGSPRVVTAVAPVLLAHADRLNLPGVHAELERVGRGGRLAWVVDNTLLALEALAAEPRGRDWGKRRHRIQTAWERFLEFAEMARRADPPDILDATVRSQRTLRELEDSASAPSRRWQIVTSVQPDDFVQALRAAHGDT